MKARIEKKLCKRLVQIAPTIFNCSWVDEEPSSLAYVQGTRVSHIPSIGGEADYWGEGTDYYNAWEWWRVNWEWYGDFEPYPAGHQFAHYPNIDGFKRTTVNLLKLAAAAEDRSRQEKVKP
ncbi:hypothetical protein [Pseudomonas leptonychotis]|uniref:hypothetical protein n=1 Tax=Pseudomonas leptonychotis TaxID=2448482 RepID=UPI003864C66B